MVFSEFLIDSGIQGGGCTVAKAKWVETLRDQRATKVQSQGLTNKLHESRHKETASP